jgi:hypothetical protein
MTILTALLIVAVAAFAILFFLLWRGPAVAQIETGAPVPVDCPSGAGAPVCYGADVTNVGDAAQQIRCQVTPGPDSAALFGNGDDVYSSPVPLEVGNSITLTIRVSPSEGSTIVSEPTVSCEAV